MGTIEGAYFLKTGRRERFSQQQLIDCSWGEGNNGCDGGEDFRSVSGARATMVVMVERTSGQSLGRGQ